MDLIHNIDVISQLLGKEVKQVDEWQWFKQIKYVQKNSSEALEVMTAAQRSQVFYARPEYCTDNGAMIALAGALRLEAGHVEALEVNVKPRWPLEDLEKLA